MLGMFSDRRQDLDELSFVGKQALPVGCGSQIWEQKGYSGNILILVMYKKILEFLGRIALVSEWVRP